MFHIPVFCHPFFLSASYSIYIPGASCVPELLFPLASFICVYPVYHDIFYNLFINSLYLRIHLLSGLNIFFNMQYTLHWNIIYICCKVIGSTPLKYQIFLIRLNSVVILVILLYFISSYSYKFHRYRTGALYSFIKCISFLMTAYTFRFPFLMLCLPPEFWALYQKKRNLNILYDTEPNLFLRSRMLMQSHARNKVSYQHTAPYPTVDGSISDTGVYPKSV